MTDYKPEPIISDSGGYRGSRSSVPEETRAEALIMIEQGVPRAEVARHIGVSPSTVGRMAAAAGLGFAGAEKVEAANHARLIQLQERRIDAQEQTHLAYEQALALVMLRAANRPDDARALSESAKALRDIAASYESLAKIDAHQLGGFADEAAIEWMDSRFVALGIREPNTVEIEETDHDQPS